MFTTQPKQSPPSQLFRTPKSLYLFLASLHWYLHHVTTNLENYPFIYPILVWRHFDSWRYRSFNYSHRLYFCPSSLTSSSFIHCSLCTSMKRNLISIFKIWQTNNVSLNYYLLLFFFFFFVKDHYTGVILVQRNTKDGVYERPLHNLDKLSLVAFFITTSLLPMALVLDI